MRLQACLVALLFMITSCDDHIIGEPSAEFEAGVPIYETSWAGVEEMFVDYCDVCHVAGGSGSFDLHTAINTELNGVGDSNFYVVPGDADGSAIWLAISGAGTVQSMPPTGQLDAEYISHVEAWINDGAFQ